MSHCINKVVRVLLVVVFLVSALACQKQLPEVSKKVKVRPVKLLTIESTIPDYSRSYPAVIDAAKSADLSFQVGGQIQEIYVVEAQDVVEGSKIGRLDTRDFKRKVDSAKATYNNAESEFQRALSLSKTGAISRGNLEERESQRDVAKAQLELAQKALADTVVYAPYSGVISAVPAERLQMVKAGDVIASIIAITDQQFEAKINLPATVLATMTAREDFDAFVILDAAPDQRISAAFSKASLKADPISQTYQITFTFLAPDEFLILPGMNATVEIELRATKAVAAPFSVAVPLAAIFSNNEEQYVWLLDSTTMTVSKREVVIEDGIGENIKVTEGLMPGDIIAAAGAAYLSEGMKIRPWSKD